MDFNSTCKELCSFISSQILADGVSIDKDTNLKSIGIDSFSLIELVLFIEQKHGIILPDDYLVSENFESVATLANALKSINNPCLEEQAS